VAMVVMSLSDKVMYCVILYYYCFFIVFFFSSIFLIYFCLLITEEVQDTVFVSGLPEDATEAQIAEYFGSIGVIKV
jgi:RNA-binding protein